MFGSGTLSSRRNSEGGGNGEQREEEKEEKGNKKRVRHPTGGQMAEVNIGKDLRKISMDKLFPFPFRPLSTASGG